MRKYHQEEKLLGTKGLFNVRERQNKNQRLKLKPDKVGLKSRLHVGSKGDEQQQQSARGRGRGLCPLEKRSLPGPPQQRRLSQCTL